ncbi:MAG: monovalent cation:proton antiporter-2 (CPA2) family protein [Gammaproteobacteria bacterium]|nr:monovalent cation:proton antiporter-2 (CPA2) family protein [Gammaproteobacteria bacterium]
MTETHYILDIIVLLAAAVVAVPLFQRLGLGAVLGFLIAGAAIGPWGFGFIVAVEEIRHLAEFGVVFLLFIIGIELKPARLWIMRRTVFGLGTAQLLATGTVLMLVSIWFGLSPGSALVVGLGLALSSTAFGLQILSDKGELGTEHGRTAFSILLLQDLAIVPMMALLPLLASTELTLTQDVELAALEAVFILTGVFILGRLLLRPLLRLVAESKRNPEIFTATAILLVIGAAWLTGWAGLSMALGAFLGGLLLADSRYRHQIMADIQPFRGLLLGLFFMSVGMSIDFGLIATRGLQVAGLVGGLLLIKVAVVWGLCRATGRGVADSMHTALLLAQAGEFGFVIFGLGNMAGIVDPDIYQLLLLIIALSMVATPLLVKLGSWIGQVLEKQAAPSTEQVAKPIPASRNHIIVAGFGRFGKILANSLAKAKVPYLVLDIDPAKVAAAQALNHPVYFGDASQSEVLRAAGAEHSLMVVFAMNQMESIGQAVVTAREAFPSLKVYARAWDSRMAQKLLSLGASYAIPETLESSQQLSWDVLSVAGVPSETVARLIRRDPERKQYRIGGEVRIADTPSGYQSMLLVLTADCDEEGVLAYTAALAADCLASLTVVELLADTRLGVEEGVSSPDELEDRMMKSRRERLEKLVAGLRDGLQVQTKVLVGRPPQVITREVAANGHGLVLKPAEGVSGWRQRLFGGNDEKLLKACPCPILLIRTIPPVPYRHRRICAGIYQDEKPGGHRDDRYAINRNILLHAARLSSAQFAELSVIHAWEAYGEQDMQSGFSPFQFEAQNYVEQEQSRNKKALDKMLAEVRESTENEHLPVFNPVCYMVKGSHRESIIRFANDLQADLVIVGSAAQSGITDYIVDNTAMAITRQLQCSVLVAKARESISSAAEDES